MKYRKKPVVIEAMQWDGKNTKDIQLFVSPKVLYQERRIDGKLIVDGISLYRTDYLLKKEYLVSMSQHDFEEQYEPIGDVHYTDV